MTWSQFLDDFRQRDLCRVAGQVSRVTSLVVEASGPPVRIGELCMIDGPTAQTSRAWRKWLACVISRYC